jgi:uncharacterized protein (DUF2344 family)
LPIIKATTSNENLLEQLTKSHCKYFVVKRVKKIMFSIKNMTKGNDYFTSPFGNPNKKFNKKEAYQTVSMKVTYFSLNTT